MPPFLLSHTAEGGTGGYKRAESTEEHVSASQAQVISLKPHHPKQFCEHTAFSRDK